MYVTEHKTVLQLAHTSVYLLRTLRHIYLHYVTFTYITSHLPTLRHIYQHYVTFTYITSHLPTLRHIYLHYVTFAYITSHLPTLRHICLHYVTFTYIYFLTCLLNHNVFRNLAVPFLEQVTCGMYVQAFVMLYRLLEWPIDPLFFHHLHLFICTLWRQLLVGVVPFYRSTLMLFWPFVCALP